MKKYLRVLFVFLVCLMLGNLSAFAGPTLNNMFAYTISGKNYKDVNTDLVNLFGAKASESAIPTVDYAYFRTKSENSHCFIKLYPAHENTNVFVVSDEKYNKASNPMTEAFDVLSYKYTDMKDKDAFNEYKNDFISYARKGAFEGLFVLPDYLSGVKKGVSKVSQKAKKKSKKTVALPYKNEPANINLPCIDENTYTSEDNQVTINQKEYRLKFKENKYAHAFEYVITNNGSTDLVLNSVKGESVANIVDIEAQSLIDLDRVDALSWTAVFPPLLVATCGTSVLLKAPAYYRNVRVAEEVTRYSKSFPENYKIPAGTSITVVTMQYKEQRKPLKFHFTRGTSTFEADL